MKQRTPEPPEQRRSAYLDNGLEPPKLYRREQQQAASRQQRQAPPMTRQERRKKQNKRRRLKRSVRRALAVIGLVLLAVAIVAVLCLTVFFKIESITVTGSKVYDTEKVLSVCTIETGENLFLADTDKAAQQLQQALPYVYSAKIKRKLPGTVQIQVTDAAPAYAVKNKDKSYTLMDDRFKVLEVVQKKPKESILIQKANLKSAKVGQTAQFANKNVAACLTQLAQVIRDYQFTEATAICSEGLNSNSIVYDGRIVFKLGTCEKLEKKIHQGLAACAQLDQDNPSVKGTLRLTGEKQYYFTED